ncbi:hypothetical protein [Roseomonas sp. KE2513]|uniref:hypothetical protein n=1 Tax=Roseomonas sp. KE2513 TaxID=2479202 RepID=UPI0018DF38F5|nr:hypothetical protein [Roseomonas sp. KE2513]
MPGLTPQAEVRFCGALGIEPTARDRFTPFFHEVVGVVEDPTVEEPVVDEVLWPALRFGHMLFARAGVRVRCQPGMLDSHLATSTTLYFARRRRHRRTEDLSLGWGSNSQWRTAFRRDYAEGGRLFYNVDAHDVLGSRAGTSGPPVDEDLTDAERVELVTHRCLVRTTKPDGDRWPYRERYVEPDPLAT